jgi:hypothetical protein
MKNNYLSSKIILFLLLTSCSLYSQNKEIDKEKISKYIEDYFFLERENIHLQPDKTTFISDEEIWLKGYIYHRKEKVPFFTTTNVYAVLYDGAGTKISEKLFYATNGSFSGKFDLGDSFKTGTYYIQAYTNWMNNFKEDESTTLEINIINKKDNALTRKKISDETQISILFNPEGGSVIENSINNIGIKITDCLGNSTQISEAEIQNSKNEVIQKVKINNFGLGKFSVNPDVYPLKIACIVNGKKIEKELPPISSNLIGLEINNYTFSDKTIAKVRTNKKNIDNLKKTNLYFVIQQDDKTAIFDVNFSDNNLEQTLVFSNNNLFEGVNSIRIIDQNMKQLAERYVFKYPKESLQLNFDATKKVKDSISFSGKLNFPNNSISISVLPENSIAISENENIFSSFLIKPYLGKNLSTIRYFFNEISKLKHYELDLFLLNQNSGKYNWNDIITQAPKNTNDFDFGLTLKGTLNQEIKDKKKYKIRLFSLKTGIDEITEINSKNEFFFNNLILADSTWVNFTLIDDKNKSTPLKLYPQIINGRRAFNKPFIPKKFACNVIEEKIEYDMPDFAIGSVTLDDVEISVVQKKTKLKYQNTLGNGNLRGYKVTEDADNFNMDVLSFIRNNGFDVPNNSLSSSVQILSRARTSINGGAATPIVYIDGMQQLSFDMLLGMKMSEIDEIYLNAHAIVPSVRNNVGIIRIYRKMGSDNPNYKSDAIPFEIKNAFAKIENFKNNSYVSSESKGFQNFGIVNWIPTIMTQDNGEFKFEIPNMNQKKVKLLIEGFSADGRLISEIRTFDLQ